MPSAPSKTLETFPNPEPERDYLIEIETPEFTCLCPKTGQPDFATLQLEYVPDRLCVELKSLKLYIWSFRNEGHFHEKVTNTILGDLVAATQPRYMRLRAQFNVRGGVYTTVTAEHRQAGWQPPPPPPEHLPRVKQSAQDAETVPAEVPSPASTPATTTTVETTAVPSEPAAAPVTAPASPRSERFRMLRRARPTNPTAPSSATPPEAPAASPPPKRTGPARDIYIGIDIGTTGCRAIAVDKAGKPLAHAETQLPGSSQHDGHVTQDPADWWQAVETSLRETLAQIEPQRIHRLAVAGTSDTLLLCDKHGNPITPGLMYNDTRAVTEAERIAAVADTQTAAFGAGSSLAKLLWLQNHKKKERGVFALQQADWIANQLTGNYGHSDYHNCVRLGYDVDQLSWPAWMEAIGVRMELLPHVHAPGEGLGKISKQIAADFDLPGDVEVVAGTTSSVAAFIAAGATKPGHGVTVLGNTLVVMLLSEKHVVAPANGIYSHRLGRFWLAGGTSNSGGNVLLQYFTPEQLSEMTPLLEPEQPTELYYYPLPDVGERFPINDPRKLPKLEPLPGDSLVFLQGILEGMARIEAEGYATLTELGAPRVSTVWTAGNGSQNPGWTCIRERALGIKLKPARSPHSAYGTALVAGGILQKHFA